METQATKACAPSYRVKITSELGYHEKKRDARKIIGHPSLVERNRNVVLVDLYLSAFRFRSDLSEGNF